MKIFFSPIRFSQAIVCTAILAGATLSSCNNVEEALEATANATLDINVSMDEALTRTATPVSGTSFSGAASLGVSLYKANKTALYATSGASNVEYKTTNGSTWTATSPISINNTEGVVTAYYPYASGTTITSIPMKTSDNKDWMYQPFSTETYSVASHQADIHLTHAQAILNMMVYNSESDAYTGAGLISTVEISSDGFATSSTLNSTTGAITGTPGAIKELNINKNIGSSIQTATPQDSWFVSPLAETTTSEISVIVKIDGINYKTTTSTTIKRGHIYTLKLCLTNTGLSVQNVSISQWVNEESLPVGTLTPINYDGIHNGHEYVDLGLTSSGKKIYWATCNVGATNPQGLGYRLSWGSTSTSNTGPKNTYGHADVLKPADDAASVNWGGKWRMATLEEQLSLNSNCNWLWTSINGQYGYKVISKTNGNFIFLPYSYAYYGCWYWSSTLDDDDTHYAGFMTISELGHGVGYDDKTKLGYIRAVCVLQ